MTSPVSRPSARDGRGDYFATFITAVDVIQ